VPVLQATADESTRLVAPRPQFSVSISPRRSGHVPVLDGVRGLAILLVLIYHFTMGITGVSLPARLFVKVTSAGWCGVDLFFVLSGFLITGLLYDAKDSPHRFRNFYARRALRIFPLYYGSLALIFAALPWLATYVGGFEGVEGTGVWLGLYGTNVLVALRGAWFPLSHFWSLAVEEHFYMFWPGVVFLCGRGTALRVCVAAVLLAALARAWLVFQGATLAAYCLTVCRMDALAVGGFLALAARGPGGMSALVPLARRVGAVAALALIALGGWRLGLTFHDPAVQAVGYLLLDLFFAAALALTVTSPPTAGLAVVLDLAPLRWLGRYSYGLYVYNSIFLLAADGLSLLPRLVAATGSPAAGRLLFIVLAAAGTLGAAWLSWHLFEKHFLKLKRYFA